MPGIVMNASAEARVQIHRHEDVLFEARDLVRVDVFADFPPELLERRVRPVLLELVRHATRHTGDQHDLIAARGVEVDLPEQPSVELGALRVIERLCHDVVQRRCGLERPSGDDRVRERIADVRQHAQRRAVRQIGVGQVLIGAHLGLQLTGRCKSCDDEEEGCEAHFSDGSYDPLRAVA